MRIGIDIGGTKIEAIALDGSGKELVRKRVPTPAGDYDAVLAAIKGLVSELVEAAGTRPLSIGIGTPGSLAPATGLIQNSNSTCLIGKPLDKDISRALGCPVAMANDANCFALSEAVDGAGSDAETVFGVILGTGVGGGISIGKRVLTGCNAIAGEWGHNPLPWPREDELPGRPCYCGQKGCIETFLSGPGLSRDHESHTGTRLEGREIARLADEGRPEAAATMDRYEDRLARALVSVMNVLDPDAIVLGGGVSNIARLYDNVPRIWKKYVFTDRPVTRLLKAKYGDSSGVRGAARLCPS
ncbi:MAG: ROK family protein [Elusimicrobiota bacterium]